MEITVKKYTARMAYTARWHKTGMNLKFTFCKQTVKEITGNLTIL